VATDAIIELQRQINIREYRRCNQKGQQNAKHKKEKNVV